MKENKRAITEALSASQISDNNQQVLVRIIETMRYCIERGSALRGHRDAGVPSIDNDDHVNMGNFKAEVLSGAKSDKVLRTHSEKGKTIVMALTSVPTHRITLLFITVFTSLAKLNSFRG